LDIHLWEINDQKEPKGAINTRGFTHFGEKYHTCSVLPYPFNKHIHFLGRGTGVSLLLFAYQRLQGLLGLGLFTNFEIQTHMIWTRLPFPPMAYPRK
jgi:hypothetical protein